MTIEASRELLYLLQLASPALPVGAYSYSEGLETLIDAGVINNPQSLEHWLKQELYYGGIRLEAAIMVRGYRSLQNGDFQTLGYWNSWLSAARDSEELRLQSWQMGRSLLKLLLELQPEVRSLADTIDNTCNYAIAFAIAAAHWKIDLSSALLAYLQSWANNLIGAGVKLIPLGQTAGQKLLFNLQIEVLNSTKKIMVLDDDDLNSCGWGLSLASMNHETLYTRLFRS